MKIAICSIGSRGDIQPFLLLGEYLNRNGFQVKVASAEMFQSLASNYEVEYCSFKGDYESIIDEEALKKEIGKNPFTIKKELKEKVYPIIESSLETFYELAHWADIVLYHPKTMLDGICASMQHKLIKAYVVPAFTPTKDFTNPVLSFLPIPKFLNRYSYIFAEFIMQSFSTPVKNFRNKHGLKSGKNILDTPVIYGISHFFISKPYDYPENAHFTGFWTKNEINGELSHKVSSFVSDEKKILLITFGSMPYKSSIDINEFIDTITKAFDFKVLIVRGWGLKETKINESYDVLAVDSAPFELLFPKIDFVVHHGGAGTTAIALKSAVPQMICPVLYPFGDQHFWGKQTERVGVGVKPIPLKNLTVRKFLNSLKKLTQTELVTNAQNLKQKLDSEDGLSKIKEILEKHDRQSNR